MKDVICFGILVADAVGRPIDVVPEEDRLALFNQMELHVGGCAANTGIGLSRLGMDVGVIGKVGNDGFADFIGGRLRQEGVDALGLLRDPSASTAFTFIMISSSGRRRYLHTPGANSAIRQQELDLRAILNARILHVAGTFLMPGFDGAPTAWLLRKAKGAGLLTSVDTAFNDRLSDYRSLIEPCLPHVDYFLPSVEEAERITGHSDPARALRALKSMCPGIVGIKLGPNGFVYIAEDREVAVPPFEVDVVDTSGAGDAFVAGFLKGILGGQDIEDCARLGNAVASFAIRSVGCTSGIRSFEETLRFMEVQAHG